MYNVEINFLYGAKMTPNGKHVFRLTTILLVFIFWGLASSCSQKESPHFQTITEEILKKGLAESGAFSILEKITAIGPRLTGSPQAAAAVLVRSL